MARPESARLAVGPLPMDEWPRLVEQLLRLDGGLAGQVAERTRGHPLLAVQIVGDWVDRGLLEPADGGFRLREGERVELPDELHEVWSSRIDRALVARPDSDTLAVELAAALGADVDGNEWRECCSLAGIEPSDGLVEDLVSRRLAREGEQGLVHGWSFVHGMLRESIERRSQEQGRAHAHHATCARMLRSREGVGLATRLGRHLVAAGEAEQALGPLRFGARERLARGDYAAAEAVVAEIEEVLRALSRPPDDQSWGDCWILRARICSKRGRFDDGIRWARRALEAAEQHGWSQAAVEALLVEGALQRLTGATAAAQQQLTAARDRARALRQDRLLAEALDALGRVLMHQGELRAAEECWHEARGLYLAMRDRVGAASALWSLAHVATYGTDLEVAQRQNERALSELVQLGDRWGVGRCLNSAGEIARLRGELEAAEDYYRRAGEIMHALGAEDSASICEANVARVLVEREHYHEARVQLEVNVRDFELQHRHNALSWALTVLLVCCAAEGDWEQWQRNMARVRELLAESAYLDLDIAEVATMAGRVALGQGGLEQAREAWELARAQWQGLGRAERVQAIEAKLRELEE
jgi:tetratricopeptide (TPR) repeat protein